MGIDVFVFFFSFFMPTYPFIDFQKVYFFATLKPESYNSHI